MHRNERDHFTSLTKAVAEQRDQAAFTVLFDHFAPRLKSWLLKRGMKADEAEELGQEVMAVLWHRADLYDPTRSSLSTWLFRIARNRQIDANRRASSRTLDGHEPLLHPLDVPGVDTVLESEERDARVRQALSEIPDDQMTLVQAAFFLGQSHSQIAASTGLPLGTVKSRIRLAFERLRRALEEPSSAS
jgi:RNA polymerase sigma-70 factor (ECF subfamily)